MLGRHVKVFSAAALLALCAAHSAQAQFAVIDIASITQLIQQAQTLEQQLAAARAQIAQAQALYQSTTGDRGMQLLLSGLTRNYLPTSWSQLQGVQMGNAGSYGTLTGDVNAAITTNAVLSPAQLSALPATAQGQIGAARRTVALLQALSQEALANSSNRFGSMQQLIGAIPTATDQKGALDLQARINAEQGMLQNEQTKLQVLYQAAQSQAMADAQREREQTIIDQGHFATRFEPTPQ